MSELPGEAALPARVSATAAVPAGTEAADPAEDGIGETPYDHDEAARSVHRDLRWTVPLMVVGAVVGTYFGFQAGPKLGLAHPSVADNLRAYAMVLGGFGVFFGLLFSVIAVWPAPRYGPKPAPKPRPLWLVVLLIAGCWLAAFPFSFICLILLAVGTDSAVNGSWVKGPLVIAIGLLFGGAAAMLVVGSGVTAGMNIKPGGKVPESVRKSAYWQRFVFLLLAWAVLVTIGMIVFGVRGDWNDFWGAVATAVGSWIGYAKAATEGERPDDAFSL